MPNPEDIEAVIFPQDPEAVIYDALADTVSTGILKWIRITRIPGTDVSVRSAPRPEVFWDVAQQRPRIRKLPMSAGGNSALSLHGG